jgi:hypothetical protein
MEIYIYIYTRPYPCACTYMQKQRGSAFAKGSKEGVSMSRLGQVSSAEAQIYKRRGVVFLVGGVVGGANRR